MPGRYAGLAGALLFVILMAFPIGSGKAQGDASWHKFSGEYSFFSGEVGEKGLPTSKDAKVGIYVSGPMASRMYRYMGASAHTNSCGEEDETRAKEDLVCVRRKATGNVSCYFGLNLRSGKTVGTFDC